MTELGPGLFWLSTGASFISIALAVVAITFSIFVWWQNNSLNQQFTKVLTTINDKSENTERQINTMVTRVVDAFLEVRSEGSPTTEPPSEPIEGDRAGELSDRELRHDISRMSQALNEIRLRQRVQSSGTGTSEFNLGDIVLVPGGQQAEVVGYDRIPHRYQVRTPEGTLSYVAGRHLRLIVSPAEPQ